jgi:serine/threonine protein kinase
MSSNEHTSNRPDPLGIEPEEFDPLDQTSTGETSVRDDSEAEMRAAPDMPAEIGEILGGYKIESVLGKGGMGCVYLGRHQVLKREAAVKVLATHLSGDENYVSRFFHEAQIVNEVNHPNIVEIVDFVQTKEPLRVAYIMEVLKGGPLSHVVQNHQLSVQQTMNLTFQMCDALVAVHKIGVVHRDLKPENIFVTEPIDSEFTYVPSVKILDFGIAKKQSGDVSHQTATGAIIGTPAYMAPEQISGQGVSDKTDVYALGEILYEMLTGQRLFVGENMEIMKRKLIDEVPQLELPEDMEDRDRLHGLLSWSLAQDPKKRPDMMQFARATLEFCPNMERSRAANSAKLLDPEMLLKTPVPTALSNPTPMPLHTGLGLTPPPSKSSKLSLMIAAVGVLAVGVYLALQFGPGRQVESTQPPPPAAAVVPTKAEKPKPIKPKPMVPKTAKVKVTSIPEGAQIIDVNSATFLGTTPGEIEVTEGRDRRIRIELSGHHAAIFFARFGDQEKGFVLQKIPTPPTLPKAIRSRPPPSPPKKPTTPPKPKKSTAEFDEGDPFSKREVPEW